MFLGAGANMCTGAPPPGAPPAAAAPTPGGPATPGAAAHEPAVLAAAPATADGSVVIWMDDVFSIEERRAQLSRYALGGHHTAHINGGIAT